MHRRVLTSHLRGDGQGRERQHGECQEQTLAPRGQAAKHADELLHEQQAQHGLEEDEQDAQELAGQDLSEPDAEPQEEGQPQDGQGVEQVEGKLGDHRLHATEGQHAQQLAIEGPMLPGAGHLPAQ